MILSLCGFMGCGKSTVGRNLAAFIYSDYIDLDNYIEEKLHMSVSEFYALEGEAAFREEERAALEEILKRYSSYHCNGVSAEDNTKRGDNLIISLGGGAPTYPPTAKLVKERTFCVYLNASREALYRRLSKNSAKRPVLQGKQGEDLKVAIKNLVAERESCYKEVSRMELSSSTLSIMQLTERLSKLF